MKRFDSSDSLGALISICPPKDNDQEEEKYSESNNKGYSKEFQAMLDSLEQEDCGEESFAGKKRRLSFEQVKALERYFEVENKLEPERKTKLAEELGLQPRQVAIWFQNRRARWKTKQLEKDYGLLKANYNSLKLSYEDLQQQNQALIEKIRQLKEKACRGESQESSESVKEESDDQQASENDNEKDGSVVKLGLEDGNLIKFSLGVNGSSSSSSSSNSLMTANWFQLSESSRSAFPVKTAHGGQFARSDNNNNNNEQLASHLSPFGSEEPNCNNFFSVDQAPTLYWYFPEQ